MTVEKGTEATLEVLSLRDLASLARGRIENVIKENDERRLLSQALANLEFIEQLRSLPEIAVFLRKTGVTIEIWGHGVFSNRNLEVSSQGIVARKSPSDRGPQEVTAEFVKHCFAEPAFSEEGILGKRLVSLQARQIARKFQRALDRPVKLK